MRKDLFLAFLGFWVIVIPFLPINRGSTQTALLVLTGSAIMAIALMSLRHSSSVAE